MYKKIFILGAILALSAFLRLDNLGYTDFYGDETKILYTNKTFTFIQFVLNQRKGPLQFLVAALAHKITGGFDEGLIRLPFAIAGFLSCIAVYFLVKKLYDDKRALIATFVYTVSGFYIAFARTAQYQSFILLFGITSLVLLIYYFEYKKKYLLVLSALLMAAAFLAHYDALFFLFPAGLFLLNYLKKNKDLKNILIWFVIPLFLLLLIVLTPTIYRNAQTQASRAYFAARLFGGDVRTNDSFYIFYLYNPSIVFVLVGVLAIFVFVKKPDPNTIIFLLWFIATFVAYQIIIKDPGTHIHNYILPLHILSALGISNLLELIQNKWLKYFAGAILLICGSVMIIVSAAVYIPRFNPGYPWKSSFLGPRYSKDYHVFLYGFPYNRAIRQVQAYLYAKDRIRNIYSNDNDVVATFYFRRYHYQPSRDELVAQYFIYVTDKQEPKKSEFMYDHFIVEEGRYALEKTFDIPGNVPTRLYRRLTSN